MGSWPHGCRVGKGLPPAAESTAFAFQEQSFHHVKAMLSAAKKAASESLKDSDCGPFYFRDDSAQSGANIAHDNEQSG